MLRVLAAVLAILVPLSGAAAQDHAQKILAPDLERIAKQRSVIDDVVRDRYGKPLTGGSADLAALQRLIDDRVFRADQTYELQSLGIVLGEVLAAYPGLAWVSVQDQYGTDPALRYKSSSILIFPLTMISKRVEEGREVDVEFLYQRTLEQIQELAKKVG